LRGNSSRKKNYIEETGEDMKAFARVTAVIFMIVGLLIIFGGIVFAISGFTGQTSNPNPAPSIVPDFSGLIVLARIVGGGAIGLQGLFLSAIGQVLWLLGDIANNTERTSQAILALLRRTSQPNQ
jgi:quinol-cytochrome oxidoreductase complex cytochrome b subunit